MTVLPVAHGLEIDDLEARAARLGMIGDEDEHEGRPVALGDREQRVRPALGLDEQVLADLRADSAPRRHARRRPGAPPSAGRIAWKSGIRSSRPRRWDVSTATGGVRVKPARRKIDSTSATAMRPLISRRSTGQLVGRGGRSDVEHLPERLA